MKKSQPRPETIHKYAIFLKSAVVKMKREVNYFSAKRFCRENKLPNSFIQHCVKLGYISKVGDKNGAKYFPIIDFESIGEHHGLSIAGSIGEYNVKHRENITADKESRSKNNDNFSMWVTDQRLIDELKDRGYSGSLKRDVTVTKCINF